MLVQIMKKKDNYTMMLEALIQGLIPNMTLPVLNKIDSLIQSLQLDVDAFGMWFDKQLKTNNLSLQNIDFLCMLYQYIAYDIKNYIQEQYQEEIPELHIHCDDEDTNFTNWQELLAWFEHLEKQNPKSSENGFIKGLHAFYG